MEILENKNLTHTLNQVEDTRSRLEDKNKVVKLEYSDSRKRNKKVQEKEITDHIKPLGTIKGPTYKSWM
jgi:predicted RNase H-like nuclease (RuvC/YqgF family)